MAGMDDETRKRLDRLERRVDVLTREGEVLRQYVSDLARSVRNNGGTAPAPPEGVRGPTRPGTVGG